MKFRWPSTTLTVATLSAVLAFACTDGGDDSSTPDAAPDGGDSDSADTDTGFPTGPCDDDYPRNPFDGSAESVAYDQPVPAFTLTTLGGELAFPDDWSGCDNFIFVFYKGNDAFWDTSINELVDDSAENAHYVFVSTKYSSTPEGREEAMTRIRDRIEAYLETKPDEVKEHWAGRFHYVLDDGRAAAPIADVLALNASETHFTVDRHQLVREGYSVSYYSGGNWVPQLRNTRYWARYYNAQHALDLALAEEEEGGDVLVHRVADGVEITAGEPFVWELPDAATIAEYGVLEVDMHVDCPGAGHPYVSTCGEWDTVGGVFLCSDAECAGDKRRIIKWITPYSSPGRWLIDISPELVPLAAGGALTFVAAHGDNDVGAYTYRYTVDLRFSHREDGLVPLALEELIPRGNYAFAEMADAFDPWVVTAPVDTVAVELNTRISGHGAVSGSYCAEFCTFEHEFLVNGTSYLHQYLMENINRCAEWVDLGVTPNQGGTWHFDRSSWCPGWTIEEWRPDITDAWLSGENTIEHVPTHEYGPPPGGNMDARVELVFLGEPADG